MFCRSRLRSMSLVVVAHRVISRGAAAIQVAIGAPELRVGWRSRPRDGRAGNIGSKTAGTNLGAPASLAIGWRACRRQVNTCCGISPFRRATSVSKPEKSSFRRSKVRSQSTLGEALIATG